MNTPITSRSYSSFSQSQKNSKVYCGVDACGNTATTSLTIPSSFIDEGYFAFAKIKDEICLVQVSSSTPVTPLTTIDIKIFRHEFITIFRLLDIRTMHPGDISVIERIDDKLKCYEEEKETVFLAKEVVERMRKLSLYSRPHPGQFRPRTRMSRTTVPSTSQKTASVLPSAAPLPSYFRSFAMYF